MVKRSFRVIKVESVQGAKKGAENFFVVRASSPSSAARKAGGKICALSKISGVCTLDIHLKEITRGGKGKEYAYKIKRKTSPKTVEIDGKEVQFWYEVEVKAIAIE